MFKIDRRHIVETPKEPQSDQAPALDVETMKKIELERLGEAIAEKTRELESLRAQAGEVLAKAQEDASAILMKTSKEADVIKKEAWQEGYQLGREEAQDIVDDAQKTRKAEMERFMEQLQKTREELLSNMEGEIIDFSMTVAEKVVGAALDRDSALFVSIIENALIKMKREGKIVVQMNPNDQQRCFDSDTARITLRNGEKITVAVAGNNRMKKNGCIVETDSDRVDTGVDTLFNGIRKAVESEMKATG